MNFGPFEVTVVPGGITVGRGTIGLLIAPGEVDLACSVVGTVMKMQSLKAFPPRIRMSPFEVSFREFDGKILCSLTKKKAKEKVEFYFSEGDQLLKALQGGVKQHTDYITVGSGKRRRIPGATTPEPPMDGLV